MKTAFTASLIIIALALASRSQASGDEPSSLPACTTGDDWDGDGVLNASDVTPDDDCSTATGDEDCTTGAGDGIPDCDATGL